jgi:hypothetical protein
MATSGDSAESADWMQTRPEAMTVRSMENVADQHLRVERAARLKASNS